MNEDVKELMERVDRLPDWSRALAIAAILGLLALAEDDETPGGKVLVKIPEGYGQFKNALEPLLDIEEVGRKRRKADDGRERAPGAD